MSQESLFPLEQEVTDLPPVPGNPLLDTTAEEESGYDLMVQQFRLPIREKDLPPIIRENVQISPASRKHAMLIACLSPLCALSTRVRLKYPFDKRLHALLLQVIIEAPPSMGKGFADMVIR